MDHEGRTQQSLVISTPKYHKRYILPGKYLEFSSTFSSYGAAFFFHFYYIQFLLLLKSMFVMLNDHIFTFLKFISSVGETMHGANRTKSKHVGYNLDDEDEWPNFRNGISCYPNILIPPIQGLTLSINLYSFYYVCIPKLFELLSEKHHHLQQGNNKFHLLLQD